MLSRRKFGLLLTTAIIMTGASRVTLFDRQAQAAGGKHFEITRSDEEWRRLLTPDQYEILRGHGTERAGSSPLDDEKRAGTFACAGCDLPLFSSKTKYDSRTGWPSFWAPLDDAIGTSVDNSFFMTRIEVHCRRCGGHLGHVFEDGPPPTGLRYCMNGIAMTFVPDEAQTSGNT
jgi:peptide-methionine (R)-S-oxide reductase